MKTILIIVTIFVGLWLTDFLDFEMYTNNYSDNSTRNVINIQIKGFRSAKRLNYYDHKIAVCKWAPEECVKDSE